MANTNLDYLVGELDTPTEGTVSMLFEVPVDLRDAFREFLDSHPTWDQDRLIQACMGLFLLQQNIDAESAKKCSRLYLDALFEHHV